MPREGSSSFSMQPGGCTPWCSTDAVAAMFELIKLVACKIVFVQTHTDCRCSSGKFINEKHKHSIKKNAFLKDCLIVSMRRQSLWHTLKFLLANKNYPKEIYCSVVIYTF